MHKNKALELNELEIQEKVEKYAHKHVWLKTCTQVIIKAYIKIKKDIVYLDRDLDSKPTPFLHFVLP
jgi:hypothetical protein